MSEPHQSHPIDPESASRLAADGLRFELVMPEQDAVTPWTEAVNRGFHEPRPKPERIESLRHQAPHRRIAGVWDDTLDDAAPPVATASSWPTPLTVPGGRSVTSWAISTITVSPTHRRRGIATAMLEAELRTALALGAPVAILTASEATIYGRWGFAPAAMTATWTIDTARALWAGPRASGRVQYVTSEQLLVDGHDIVERARLATPGLIGFEGQLWERLLGIGDEEEARRARFLRYDDAAGVAQGFAIYTVAREETHSGRAIIEVGYAAGVTDEAYAAIWRFLFELDLVGEVRAPLRPVTEPFSWQIRDGRAAVKSKERDHLWTRILDVPAALEARSYAAPGRAIFEVSDALGFAAGRWLLEVDEAGVGHVTRLGDAGASPDVPAAAGTAAVALGVKELSAIYLGGVSAALLARAGTITELTDGAADAVDAMFRSSVTPWLSIWF
ncbi:GNAT family N-acetyltransferase [Parafrigoribacterium soli]|uniref:GNAT family N-acetyltransferase n=1 Tax=Parafrigoribacterium soli TaxID=3144663 RepID=UPI0032EF475B